MSIDVEPSIGSSIHIVLHGGEIHIAAAIYAATHLHSITSYSFREVLVNQAFDCRIVQIVIDGCSGTEFKIRVLRVIYIIFESRILIQISVFIIVRFTHLKSFLCHSRCRKTE